MALRNKTHPSTPNGKRDRNLMQRSMPTMSERQLDAYLSAREAIRRIQRTSPLVFPALAARSSGSRSSRD